MERGRREFSAVCGLLLLPTAGCGSDKPVADVAVYNMTSEEVSYTLSAISTDTREELINDSATLAGRSEDGVPRNGYQDPIQSAGQVKVEISTSLEISDEYIWDVPGMDDGSQDESHNLSIRIRSDRIEWAQGVA